MMKEKKSQIDREIKRGTWFMRNTDQCIFKVLAVFDGYAALRFKGAMPFIESIKDLQNKYAQIV